MATQVPNRMLAFDGGNFAFRNKIINGNMAISQRGTSFSIPALTPNIYTLDRWSAYNATTTGAFTVSRFSLGLQDVNPTNDGSCYALRAVVNTADTSLVNTEHVSLVQFIEGNNIHNLLYKTFTLSFWVRSSKPGAYSVSFRNGDTVTLNIDRSYVSQYTINAANTWEYKTVTVVGGINPTVGSGWNLDEKAGLHVLFVLANATTYRTSTLDQWQNGNFLAGSSQLNFMDTVNNEFYVTGVQLEEGSVATPFEQRPIGTELALCQRYYEKSYDLNVAIGTPRDQVGANGVGGYTAVYVRINVPTNFGFAAMSQFRTTKRSRPSVNLYSYVLGTLGQISNYTETNQPDRPASAVNVSTNAFDIVNTGSTLTTPTPVYHWTADAEL